jgi:hypothetical protein
MQKDKNIAYVFADQYGMSLIHPTEKDRLWFDLNNSLHHDSLIIAGNWMHDVYEYACTDTASAPYKKMFVKNGTGIVRFTLKDNQSFELLKYIKNEKND